MNIINKLTLRQLILNKKRTLVTIFGAIISAAMITAVATLGLSFIDVMQRQSIEDYGEWHAKYIEVNKAQLESIKEDREIKTAVMGRELGYSYLEGSDNSNKPYLYVMEYNKEGFDSFPIDLLDGRLPEKADELVISEAILKNARVEYRIGDTLELSIGQRQETTETGEQEELEERQEFGQNYALLWDQDVVSEYLTEELYKTYTIVGIIQSPTWEYTWAPGYTVISYIDEHSVSAEDTFDVSVIFHKVNNKLFEHAQEILPRSEIIFNSGLLRYYGVYADDSVRSMIYTLSAIIMVIIVIGSVALIYNAFAISVAERSRYLGMLASVGATKRQKRNSVFFEGAVIGAISIPIGIASGYLGLGITYLCINPLLKGALSVSTGFKLVVYPSSLFVSVIISIITILISTYLPARKASNISAIDAIRQSGEVRISKKQVKTLKITRKLFGIEGDLGLKNLKRNRTRYKATIFSLVISMMLFLAVTAFTDTIKKSYGMTQDGITFDITASITAEGEEKEAIIQKVTSLHNIKEYSRVDSTEVATWVEEANIASFLSEGKENILVEGKYPYQITINALSEDVLKQYANEVGVDYELLFDLEQPHAIVIDTVNYKDAKTDKYVLTQAVKTKVGEEFNLSIQDDETSEISEVGKVKVAGTTDKLPMGIMSTEGSPSFHIIVSKVVFDKMMGRSILSAPKTLSTKLYFNSKEPLRLQEAMEKVQESVGASKISLLNLYLYKQREQQMMLLVSVFTYAFLILITAICIANIINTISTSIALRKREFAMLKSVGITPKGFNKMLNYESIFYGLKALLYGLPISIAVMYLIHRAMMDNFNYAFTLPMRSIGVVIISVFIIVGVAMLYSSYKVRKENIIDALRQEIA